MIEALPTTIVSRLVEESLDAVAIIDEFGTIRYLNGAMLALCGYPAAQALGQPLDMLLPETLASHHNAYLRHFLDNGKSSTVLGKVREFTIRHRSGETIPIEMKALDLGLYEGRRYLGAFMQDLRQRRAMEAKNAALLAQLEQQALSDPLTGLPNRRAFEAEAARLNARAQRSGNPNTVGIADVDRFKSINDMYGHPVGDMVLDAVAKAIGKAARSTDFVARTGGEEFGLLFPEVTAEQARVVAERVRLAVAATQVTTPEGERIGVTLSIGLAGLGQAGLGEALVKADSALYQAKRGGRNRVEQA